MWEGTAGGLLPNLFVLPALGSDQVAQGFSELGLGNLQGWRQQSLSGHPISVLNCSPHSGNIFSRIQSEPPWLQLMSSVCCVSLVHLCVQLDFIISMSSLQVHQSFSSPALHSQPPSPGCVIPQGCVSSDCPDGLALDSFPCVTISLVLEAVAISSRGVSRAEQRGGITFLDLLAMLCLMQPEGLFAFFTVMMHC